MPSYAIPRNGDSAFRREARALAGIQHDHVVAVYRFEEIRSETQDCLVELYLILEYVEGGTWLDRIHASPLSPRDAATMAKTLAETMHQVYEQCQVVHRDLKPANILLTRDGNPKITDFGLAKVISDDNRYASLAKSRGRLLLGTPSYMALEQVECRPQCDSRTDVYGLGATLYEMLTGKPPFSGRSDFETLSRVISKEPSPPKKLNSAIPTDLNTICLKCLEKNEKRRYQTWPELAEDLGRFLNGEPIQARPVGIPGRLWRWGGRHRALAASLAALVLAVCTVAGLAIAYTLKSLRTEQIAEELRNGLVQANYKADREAILPLFNTLMLNRFHKSWTPLASPERAAAATFLSNLIGQAEERIASSAFLHEL